MKKLIPPNIFLIKKEEKLNASISRLDFHEKILLYLKEKSTTCCLNFPETIIKISKLNKSYLLHTDEGTLVYSENLSDHTIQKFYKRCTYYKLPNYPLCIIKILDGENEDNCITNSKISHFKDVWYVNDAIIIQRYIVSGLENICKARIIYYIKREAFTGKLISKQHDCTFKIGKNDNLIEEDMTVNENLQDQMICLYKILKDENSKLEITEITADFVQDFAGIWYFINFISGKLEKVKKIIKNPQKSIHEVQEIQEKSEFLEENKELGLQEEAINDINSMLLKMSPKPKQKIKSGKKKLKKLLPLYTR